MNGKTAKSGHRESCSAAGNLSILACLRGDKVDGNRANRTIINKQRGSTCANGLLDHPDAYSVGTDRGEYTVTRRRTVKPGGGKKKFRGGKFRRRRLPGPITRVLDNILTPLPLLASRLTPLTSNLIRLGSIPRI